MQAKLDVAHPAILFAFHSNYSVAQEKAKRLYFT